MPRITPVSKQPFTRLPASQTESDLYDKTASIALTTDANKTAIEQNKAATDATAAATAKQLDAINNSPSQQGRSVVNVRRVTQSAYLQLSDHTLIFLVSGAAICTLPNCRAAAGAVFSVKNDAGSGAAVTLNSVGNETVDGAAANTISLSAAGAVTIQSDGTNWLILSQFP